MLRDFLLLPNVVRLSKGLIALSIGIFCLLVSTGNMLDFQSNYQFVKHVLAMDALEPWFKGGEALKWRAITSPTLQLIGYWIIILGELLAGIFATWGAINMLRRAKTGGTMFQKGKSFFLIGGTIAILVWYFGFAVVGGEWFAMWASQWNGQMKAYAFATFILLSIVYMLVPEPS